MLDLGDEDARGARRLDEGHGGIAVWAGSRVLVGADLRAQLRAHPTLRPVHHSLPKGGVECVESVELPGCSSSLDSTLSTDSTGA